MPGLRGAVKLIKIRFTRAVSWLRSVRTETLPPIDPAVQIEGLPEQAAGTNSKVARVSVSQENPLWYTSSLKTNFRETNEVRLARLPPAKGLLNLVDLLSKDTSQSDHV